jgi:hypothetical protein
VSLSKKYAVIQKYTIANKTKKTENKNKDAPRTTIVYEAIKI